MPLSPSASAEVGSAARILAHITHLGDAAESEVLAALGLEAADWEGLRDAALDRAAGDTDAGLLLATVFAKTKRDLAARNITLQSLAPPVSDERAAPPSPASSEPAVVPPPPDPSVFERAPEKPSFALGPAPARSFTEAAARAAPPALSAQGAPALDAPAPAETVELDPEMIRRAAMPFAPGVTRLPPAAVPSDGSGSDGDTLPVSRSASAVEPLALGRRAHAELCADLDRLPQAREALLRERGLTEQQFRQIDAEWRRRLAEDRIQSAQWHAAFVARRNPRA